MEDSDERPAAERAKAMSSAYKARIARLKASWGSEPWQQDFELIEANVATSGQVLRKKGKSAVADSGLGEVLRAERATKCTGSCFRFRQITAQLAAVPCDARCFGS